MKFIELPMENVKFIIAAILASLMALQANARNVGDFFASESGDIFLPIKHDTRLDMLDYYNAGQKMPMPNNFGGKSEIDTVAGDYMKIKMSDSRSIELLMAASKRDTVIYIVTTYALPAPDSQVATYDRNWNTLDTDKYFKQPQLKDFINIPKGDKSKREDVASAARFDTFLYSTDPQTKSIVARPTVKGHMSIEAYDYIKPYLADSIVYKLKGNKFKRED